MFLNLTALRSELGNRLKSTQTISDSRKDLWLNQAQDELAIDLDPKHLEKSFTLTTVASTHTYYIPGSEYLKVLSLQNSTTNLEMIEQPFSELEEIDPDYNETGAPHNYILLPYSTFRAQNSVAGTVTAVSSSASDTTQKVRIIGLVNGIEFPEVLTLNGTSTQTTSTSFDINGVLSITKDADTVGKVTVARGADTLAIIAPGDRCDYNQPVRLYPIPDDVYSLVGRCIRRPRRMINAQDFPDFPPSCHEMILIAALVRGHRDLFRPQLAQDVQSNELMPLIDRYRKQVTAKHGKLSPVIRGRSPYMNREFRRYVLPIGS